jgi:hypothetical protein
MEKTVIIYEDGNYDFLNEGEQIKMEADKDFMVMHVNEKSSAEKLSALATMVFRNPKVEMDLGIKALCTGQPLHEVILKAMERKKEAC